MSETLLTMATYWVGFGSALILHDVWPSVFTTTIGTVFLFIGLVVGCAVTGYEGRRGW